MSPAARLGGWLLVAWLAPGLPVAAAAAAPATVTPTTAAPAAEAPATISPAAAMLAAAASTATGAATASWDTSSVAWWLRLHTTTYRFQSFSEDVKLDQLGVYQGIDGAVTNLARGRLELIFSGRVQDDAYLKPKLGDRFRLYTGYLGVRPGPDWRLRLGRQFLAEDVGPITLDGLWGSVPLAGPWSVRLWGGWSEPLIGDAPVVGAPRLLDDRFGKDGTAGGRLFYAPRPWVRGSLGFGYLELGERVAARLASGEAWVRAPRLRLRGTARGSYDFAGQRWRRVEALVQWTPRHGLPVLSLQGVDRYPLVGGTYFDRFDVERVRLARFAARYRSACGWGGEADYLGSFVEERTATRLGGAVLFPYGRAGYSARVGNVGEESRWFGEASVPVLAWLDVGAGADLASYQLLAGADRETVERELTSYWGRARVKPRDGLMLVLEVQALENPFYEKDVRFLAGLDLTAGRGAGNLGLMKRGWAW